MKKIIFIYALLLILSGIAKAQGPPIPPASYSIPFDLTLAEVLRVNITSGGNLEFVFNNMNQYNIGIVNSSFYDTNVQIASSSNWQLHLGAESDLIGTDNPLNIIDRTYVGFTVTWLGLNSCCGGPMRVSSATGTYDNAPFPLGVANGLALFTGAAGDILFTNGTGGTNGGDIADNRFTIHWECGTGIAGGTTSMHLLPSPSLLGNVADRYVTTVFIELEAL